MAAALPEGEQVSSVSELFSGVTWADAPTFSAYVHIPFCRVRCGYCDFNTYTSTELGGLSQNDYASLVESEIAVMHEALGNNGTAPDTQRPWDTIFFGGGTPTLLPATDLVGIINALRACRGIASGAEITVEANPDTLTHEYVAALAAGGVTRISLGMQSAVPHVLAALDRSHKPENVTSAVAYAKDAGLDVSVDLIYGAPGESLDDWRRSLDAAVALETDHVSAYALIVEEGTKLARQIARGDLSVPDDDLMADMYEHADQVLSAAGFEWYEVSNWARSDEMMSRHNLAYWKGGAWLGFGPGAHSHFGNMRWWNVKHPAAYAEGLTQRGMAVAAREVLSAEAMHLEHVLLLSRLRSGYQCHNEAEQAVLSALVSQGLANDEAAQSNRLILTVAGRLRADEVVRRLTSEK